ncbi:hypothetical protein O3W44_22680 [Pantoea sp. LMR881]|uniref:hypothetical protein n=1 Tax=Pantoea sp. LMR881 TaxID=3014336 RepID=UPI0022AE6C34|nr:hypothetical protein [Pantoea sp. LMR881]MCZ4061224.1 hypothetical protein [Pantoea sp. LMR881]MCZ4061341.1 hypothetical protein [Pantoea sp. LMR881]
MTNKALTETRQKREEEAAQLTRAAYLRRKHVQSKAVSTDDELEAMGWNTGKTPKTQKRTEQRSTQRAPQTSYNSNRFESANREHDAALELAKANAQKNPEIISGHLNRIRDMFKGR